jgi:pimeloyl-ACP methyl ester carboxylesterase
VSDSFQPVYGRSWAYALILSAIVAAVGCTSSEWVQVRDTPHNPLAGSLNLLSPGGPKPTKRTMQLLRRFDLSQDLDGDRAVLLARLEDLQRREPNPEHEYAMAEIAYITAKRAETMHRDRALEFYGTALIHAYRYLFEQESAGGEQVSVSNVQADWVEHGTEPGAGQLVGADIANPYDPQFRGASDLYNQSLEGLLRLVRREGELRPGTSRAVKTSNYKCSFEVVLVSKGWHAEDFDRFEFVSDYKVQGLKNHYHSYGLGVPLIAVRKNHEGMDAAEQYYPESVAFPITAFLRVNRAEMNGDQHGAAAPQATNPQAPCFVLELHDPLDRQSIEVAGRTVPLEADLSTPLAYFLSQPQFQDSTISTRGLLRPGEAKELQGLYMLEPFDPHKMPVVMVHGLWSSPITWMEMYNDLRSDPLIREHYQFWFYMYPTGQPFWFSATQMREDLAMMRRRLDPTRLDPALDQMVLVGHSMGGLVSKLQTVESSDEFWHTMSQHEFAELNADEDVVQALAGTFFFSPSPSVRRVVTLGTPHRGSEFSNGVTQWLGHKLIKLPSKMLKGRNELIARNRDFFRPRAPLNITTSIDSLAPDSLVLPVLLSAAPGPWVAYHNVVGREPDLSWWRKRLIGDGDGVVSLSSARLDNLPHVRSQRIVPADHVSVHRHPQSILEVRRVLLEQLAELENFPDSYDAQVAGSSLNAESMSASLPATMGTTRW